MTLWLDAQLSPTLAPWLAATCDVSCAAIRDLGLRDAADRDIFMAGRAAGAVIVTKDADFVRMLEQLGPPPQVVCSVGRDRDTVRPTEASVNLHGDPAGPL